MVRLSRAFVAERDQRRSMTVLAAMALLCTAVVTPAFTEKSGRGGGYHWQ